MESVVTYCVSISTIFTASVPRAHAIEKYLGAFSFFVCFADGVFSGARVYGFFAQGKNEKQLITGFCVLLDSILVVVYSVLKRLWFLYVGGRVMKVDKYGALTVISEKTTQLTAKLQSWRNKKSESKNAISESANWKSQPPLVLEMRVSCYSRAIRHV
jgi:hypothetical protein